MIVAVFSFLVAVFLGFGAVQEFIMRGLRDGEVQPGVVGAAAAIVSAMILFAGIAYARRAPYSRTLLIVTGVVSLLLHGYAALPPHVNVGKLALLVAALAAVVLIAAGLRLPKSQAR